MGFIEKGKRALTWIGSQNLSPPTRNTYSGKTSHKAEVISLSFPAAAEINPGSLQVDGQDEDSYSCSDAADSVCSQASPHLMVKDNTQIWAFTYQHIQQISLQFYSWLHPANSAMVQNVNRKRKS